jgi:uncharacterized protein with ATP-grasp and redox domains
MSRYNKLLSEIQAYHQSIDVDSVTYAGYYQEQPVANIIDFDWKNLLDAPPKNSDKQTYNELQQVISLSSKRSKEDTKFIYRIDSNANSILYDYLTKNKIDFPSNKFHTMYDICKPIIANIKSLYDRARPYQLSRAYNTDIDLIVTPTHKTPSYPSGHVFYTALAANFVVDDNPNLKSKMNDIVDLTGQARMMQGVHYLSDNIGGKKLANILYNKLKETING